MSISSRALSRTHVSFWVTLAFTGVIAVKVLTTPYMAVATFAYFCLVAGLFLRRTNSQAHAAAMTTAIATDLILVLVLQFQREAIQTAVGDTLSLTQSVHVASSLLATLFYIPAATFGLLLIRNPALKVRIGRGHRFVGLSAFVFRTIGFVTMFSMLSHIKG